MAKRKYTRLGEKPIGLSCTNNKCKWQGLEEEILVSAPDEDGWRRHLCPKCGNEEFLGLL